MYTDKLIDYNIFHYIYHENLIETLVINIIYETFENEYFKRLLWKTVI